MNVYAITTIMDLFDMPNSTSDKDAQQSSKLKKFAVSWLPYILLPIVVYFGNVEVQSYLGRKALAATGLEKHSLEEALTLAKSKDKLVLADMSAIWCSSCRKLDSEVFTNAEVKNAINDKYVFARIEYESEEGEAFMEKYQVRGFPTLLILDANGNKIEKLPLTFSPKTFVELISKT